MNPEGNFLPSFPNTAMVSATPILQAVARCLKVKTEQATSNSILMTCLQVVADPFQQAIRVVPAATSLLNKNPSIEKLNWKCS